MADEQLHKIHIGNLAGTVSQFTLVKVLQGCGKIKKLAFKAHNSRDGAGFRRSSSLASGGYAFAEFFTRKAAKQAIRLLHNQRIHGKIISCTFASEKVGQGGTTHTNFVLLQWFMLRVTSV